MRICRLRAFGTISSQESLKPLRFITPLQRFSDRLSSGEAGADMPAGQHWCLIFFRIRFPTIKDGKSDGLDI